MANKAVYELPGLFDNHALPSEHFEAIPLSSALGAEIRGVDAANLSAEQFPDLEAALYRHKVIFLKEQRLSLDDQERLTACFGPFGVDAFTPGMPGHEHVQRLVKEADERRPMVFGGTWHTDSAFLNCPPSTSLLYAIDVPPYGGDTWYANTQLAYECLSDTMQRMIAPLRIHMSARKVVGAVQRRRQRDDEVVMSAFAKELQLEEMMVRGTVHPLVRTHPKTAKRSLYVDQTYAMAIEGLRQHESRALIEFLVAHIIQPVFTCRVRWEKQMLVLWDNRATLHHAFNDYDGFRRELLRTIVEGEKPY